MPFQLRVIDISAYEVVKGELLAVAKGSRAAALELASSAASRLGPRLRELNPPHVIEGWKETLASPKYGGPGARRLAFPCVAILCIVDYQHFWPFLSTQGGTAPKSGHMVVLGERRDPVLSALLAPRSPLFHTFLHGFWTHAERWPLSGAWQLLSRGQVEQLVTTIASARSLVGESDADTSACLDASAMAQRVLGDPARSICLTAEL